MKENKEVIIEDTDQIKFDKKVNELKSKYKKIYLTSVSDEKIIWRTLKRSEYKEIMALGADDPDISDKDLIYLREEALTRKVVLYPENVDDIIEDLAAVAEVISSECMEKSGFNISNDTVKL